MKTNSVVIEISFVDSSVNTPNQIHLPNVDNVDDDPIIIFCHQRSRQQKGGNLFTGDNTQWSINMTLLWVNSTSVYISSINMTTNLLVKRKHLRQNRDIIRYFSLEIMTLLSRANSAQAIRIRTMEADVRRLMDENLSLRTELIQTKCELARQSHSSALIEGAKKAQKALEKVLLDVAGIKDGLADSLQQGQLVRGQADEARPGGPDITHVSSRGVKKTVKERRRMDLKFDEFNQERKNKQKALNNAYSPVFQHSHISLEAPFNGSPRVMSETDASDTETEDVLTEDINISDFSRNPNPIPNHRDNPPTPSVPLKRTTLKNPIREQASTPPPKDNPRKRRRSEMFITTQGKENISILPPGSDLFSPPNPTRTDRSVLGESSPPRPSLIIPAGLTKLESPNKPLLPKTTEQHVVKD